MPRLPGPLVVVVVSADPLPVSKAVVRGVENECMKPRRKWPLERSVSVYVLHPPPATWHIFLKMWLNPPTEPEREKTKKKIKNFQQPTKSSIPDQITRLIEITYLIT